jgi:hypothetical protein
MDYTDEEIKVLKSIVEWKTAVFEPLAGVS